MLNEENSNHHGRACAHDGDVQDPEVPMADAASDPPPGKGEACCVGDRVVNLFPGVEKA